MTTPPTAEESTAVSVTDAYVSANSGIAVGASTTTTPDQIYVEFSAPVVLEGTDGGPVPADGFRVDGATAGAETVRLGETEVDTDTPGSRVLVLSLSRPLTADEQVTLSYTPDAGAVTTPDGAAVAPVEAFEVTLGSPHVVDVAVPADRADEIRVTFDQPVVSRTGDASMFDLAGDNGNRSLTGDIEVEGKQVRLPLTGDLTPDTVDTDGSLTLRYRAGGSDTEQPRNLAGENGALVQPFSQPVSIEVPREGFQITEASVPQEPNSSGNLDRSRVELYFDPPATAESAAGYEIRNSLATVLGLGPTGGSGTDPDVMLDLDAPVDPKEGKTPTVHYSPDTGNTRAAGNEVPANPLSAPVETAGSSPEPLSATLLPSKDAIAVEFTHPVHSQTNDAAGLKLTGAGDVALTGAISEGKTVTLELTDPLDFRETSNTVKLKYSTQSDSGRRINLVDADSGVPVETFKTEVGRHGEGATVKQARIPQDRRDAVLVRFDRPVRADTAAGFGLEGSVARVEKLTSADDLDDSLAPYTLVLGLHTEAQTGSATLTYDGDVGNVDTQSGEPVGSFEQPVDVLPPAPAAQEAVARSGESAVRVRYNRAVTLNQNDATGFSLSYGVDRDSLPTLTGHARSEGRTVVLETTDPVPLDADPSLAYQPGDEPNVLGAEQGVTAAATQLRVGEATAAVEGSDEGASADPEQDTPDAPDAGDQDAADTPDAGDQDTADTPDAGDQDAADTPDGGDQDTADTPDGGDQDSADAGDPADGPDEQPRPSGEATSPTDGTTSPEESTSSPEESTSSAEESPSSEGSSSTEESPGRIVRARIPQDRPDRIVCDVEGNVEAEDDRFGLEEVAASISEVVQLGDGRIGLQLDAELEEGDQPVVLYDSAQSSGQGSQ